MSEGIAMHYEGRPGNYVFKSFTYHQAEQLKIEVAMCKYFSKTQLSLHFQD